MVAIVMRVFTTNLFARNAVDQKRSYWMKWKIVFKLNRCQASPHIGKMWKFYEHAIANREFC